MDRNASLHLTNLLRSGQPVRHDSYLIFCRRTLFPARRYCSWLHHLFGSHWRLWPSRRQNKSRVAQQLISAHIHKICCEWGRGGPLCAATPLPWHSGSGNILEFPWHCHDNLDDLLKLARHIDTLSPFFASFSSSVSRPLWALPQASFRPVLPFPLLSFVQMRSFPSSFNHSARPIPPACSPHPSENWLGFVKSFLFSD